MCVLDCRARVAQLEMKLAEKLLTPDDVPEEFSSLTFEVAR